MSIDEEFDREVSEKVLGMRFAEDGQRSSRKCGLHPLCDMPKPSTNIQDVWLVVERMRKDDWHFNLLWDDVDWTATFDTDEDGEYLSRAETAPLAICKAALEAVNE